MRVRLVCGSWAASLLLLGTVGCDCGDDGDDDETPGEDSGVGVDASPGQDSGPEPDGGPEGNLVLEVVPPPDRFGVAGDAVDECVVLATVDGEPAAGVDVTFAVVQGGGRVDPVAPVATDAEGHAGATWTLGFGGPTQRLQASAAGATPVEFTAEATPRPIQYAVAVPYPAGGGPSDLGVGKFDGDEMPDLVVCLQSADDVAVLHNVGGGAFGVADPYETQNSPAALVVARLDDDDFDDVAVVSGSAGGQLRLYHGSGAGALGSSDDYTVGDSPAAIVAADFDGSGVLDLAVSNSRSDSVMLLPDEGDGSFGAPTTFSVGTEPTGLAVGDLNGDAGAVTAGGFEFPDYIDIVVVQRRQTAQGSSDETVGVLLGREGIASDVVAEYRVGEFPLDVALGDLDGNGDVDGVVTNTGGGGTFSVILGNGAGAFGPPTNVELDAVPGAVALGDLDGDGLPDIAITVPSEDQVQIFLNDGAGVFGGSISQAQVGNNPVAIVIADLDGDGMPDIATANANGSDVSVLIRQ